MGYGERAANITGGATIRPRTTTSRSSKGRARPRLSNADGPRAITDAGAAEGDRIAHAVADVADRPASHHLFRPRPAAGRSAAADTALSQTPLTVAAARGPRCILQKAVDPEALLEAIEACVSAATQASPVRHDGR